MRSRTIVLGYHNIVPRGELTAGERPLHLAVGEFTRQLDALGRTHDVIPLSCVDDVPRGSRPRAIITFDDAYRGALQYGLPELEKRGMHATVFVAPGLCGTAPWWDCLAQNSGGFLPMQVRQRILRECAGRANSAEFGASGVSLPDWACIATEAEIRRVALGGGVTLGAHSWSHANLAALSDVELATELHRPLEWLRSVDHQGPFWLAYPYGLTSAAVSTAAHAAGYAGAFRVEGGWLPPAATASERFGLPRLSVPSGMSLMGFRLRVAGLMAR
jgi:peptidoglycan/xylan/chitin deacetylase (PgdA/CDA1 family)